MKQGLVDAFVTKVIIKLVT